MMTNGLSNLKRFALVERLNSSGREVPTKRLCNGVQFPDKRIAVHWIETDEVQVWDSLEKMYETLPAPEFGADLFWDDMPHDP
jgi:hypothetical protein